MGTRILGIAGSLRAGSFNRALLRAAVESRGDPAPVAALKSAIGNADAILIATPEYNFGVPGVLKNAIDWVSRPPGKSVLNRKPAAIMGATPGGTGTARAQLVLRQSFVFTETYVLVRPEVLVARAHEKIDAQGRLTDEPTRVSIRQLLEALVAWTERVGTRTH